MYEVKLCSNCKRKGFVAKVCEEMNVRRVPTDCQNLYRERESERESLHASTTTHSPALNCTTTLTSYCWALALKAAEKA